MTITAPNFIFVFSFIKRLWVLVEIEAASQSKGWRVCVDQSLPSNSFSIAGVLFLPWLTGAMLLFYSRPPNVASESNWYLTAFLRSLYSIADIECRPRQYDIITKWMVKCSSRLWGRVPQLRLRYSSRETTRRTASQCRAARSRSSPVPASTRSAPPSCRLRTSSTMGK